MKHSLAASLLILATALQAIAAVVDYVSGEPIPSSGYYRYHTKWVTTTCYHTITKTKDCSYGGGDFAGDYETVSPQIYPGQDYNDYDHKTVYETLYETAYPYPSAIAHSYESAAPYPYEPVCYPETVYSTIYPESLDTIYHTFTASGIDETVSGSPVYHTVDSTLMETVTATPSGGSGGSGLECSSVSRLWVVNPSFDDSPWPGAWFLSSNANRVSPTVPFEGPSAVEFSIGGGGEVPLLEQAIILPGGGSYGISFNCRQTSGDDSVFQFTISLGSYASRTYSNAGASSTWEYFVIVIGQINDPAKCVPVVLSITASLIDSDQPKVVQIDSVQLLDEL